MTENKRMRTHKCGELNKQHLGEQVSLCGWVHRRRDHGGVIFIDLRDRTGLVQVVFDPDSPDTFKIGESVRSEYVLKIDGTVRARPEGTINPNTWLTRHRRYSAFPVSQWQKMNTDSSFTVAGQPGL